MKKKILSPVQMETLIETAISSFDRTRVVRYVSSVNRLVNERILVQIEKLLNKDADKEIVLFVTSTGGPTGSAMSFYDTLRHVLKPNLITIGSGDVDSSGILIFLTGEKRYITARTTLLLHPAGRIFGNQRFTTVEMEAMLAEDRLKDGQYASLVAECSHGKLTKEAVLTMMASHTVLSPHDLVSFGLADGILA